MKMETRNGMAGTARDEATVPEEVTAMDMDGATVQETNDMMFFR